MAELFDDFEINSTPRWPRVLRALAGSFVVHALLVVAVLTVPTLQSILHLTSAFAGADYVDEDYTLARVREQAVMIKLSPSEKLYYPPGYFTQNPTAPPAPAEARVVEEARVKPTPKPMPAPTPRPTPEPTPEQAQTAEDKSAAAGEEVAASATPAEGAPTQPKTEEELNKLAEETKTKRFPKINTKPFKDLLAKAKSMMDAGELDLSGTLRMTVEADRNDDGTLSNIRVTKVSTDNPKLKALAVEFVQVLGASRALAPLEGTKHLTLSVESTPARVRAVALTRVDTEARAAEMANSYSGMIFFGRLTRSGKEEAEIFQNTQVSSRGKELTLKFGMSRPAVTRMLAKQVKPATAGAKEAPKETPQ